MGRSGTDNCGGGRGRGYDEEGGGGSNIREGDLNYKEKGGFGGAWRWPRRWKNGRQGRRGRQVSQGDT